MNKNTPFISVVTASYNNDYTLTKTIESVKNQTFSDIEHIVVDNCSTDSTVSILKKYENTFPLNWVSEPDKGIADALNKGLSKASGKYILVIQADDYLISPDIIERNYPLLRSEKYDIVGFPVVIEGHPNKGTYLAPIRNLWQFRFKTVLRHQGTFIHRNVHEKIGIYDNQFRICMDYDLFYRALLEKLNIKLGNEPIARMRGTGVATNLENINRRLGENYKVQCKNERSTYWKAIQFLYHKYCMTIRPTIKRSYRVEQ